VEAARSDGRWEAAYAGARDSLVPQDFQAELDRRPKAAKRFAELSRTNRYAILYRIHDAKRPETRTRRISQIIDMLLAGKTFH
jgi:uncharacterized protein YdeI (YjbR/CyaY-like superfamily)